MTILSSGKKVMMYILISVGLLFPGVVEDTGWFDMPEINSEDVDLETKLSLVLTDERLQGGITGISVRDAITGNELFSKNGETRLHPASNMKLLTGAAALDVLGEEYRFSTEIWTDGMIKENTLNGNLYIKGKGDPTLVEEDLEKFAVDLKKRGINKINGDLIADDTWYDDVRLSMDLNWNDEPYYTGAQISALTLSSNADFDTGTITVELSPGDKLNGQAIISVKPDTTYITINNQTKVVESSQVRDISIEREHGTNEIVVKGTLPISADKSEALVAVWEPTMYVLTVFVQKLKQQGITVNGRLKTSQTPDDAILLISKQSIPLKDILLPFMKLSNNGIGDMLTKEMGKKVHDEGSFEKGLSVIHDKMSELGLNGSTILLRDGSGMSHKTVIPASELSKMLFVIQDKAWFPVFKRTLPIAGDPDRIDGGTLRFRMIDQPMQGNVLAKTGTINGVSTLSGYVTALDGQELIFSIMINNHLSSSISEVEDAIVMILATHAFKGE